MASPAPALITLRSQLEQRWPHRAPYYYGIMGDLAHQLRRSAHNEGNAIDVPTILLELYAANLLVETLRYDAANGYEPRLKLLIWARRSCSASSSWQWRRYLGLDRHEWHSHIEIHPALRWDGRPWRLR